MYWRYALPAGLRERRLTARFKAVSKYGGGALLPEAHTCFYDMTIPATTDRAKMQTDFIAQAIAHHASFGTV